MPERAAYALFDRIADVTVARGGAARLRANYARVRPDLDDAALDALVREGMRSLPALLLRRLPAADPERRRPARTGSGSRATARCARSSTAAARSCVPRPPGQLGPRRRLGHHAPGPVTTVAERLQPEEVFEEFLAFRESLGMTILPLTGGVNPSSRRCARRLAGRAHPAARRPRPHRPRRRGRPVRAHRPDGARPRRAGPGRAAPAVPGLDPPRAPRPRVGHRHHLPPGRSTCPRSGTTRERAHRDDPGLRRRARRRDRRAHRRLAHAAAGLPRRPRPGATRAGPRSGPGTPRTDGGAR